MIIQLTRGNTAAIRLFGEFAQLNTIEVG